MFNYLSESAYVQMVWCLVMRHGLLLLLLISIRTFSGTRLVTRDRLNIRIGLSAMGMLRSLHTILKREPRSYSSFFLSVVKATPMRNSRRMPEVPLIISIDNSGEKECASVVDAL